MSRRAERGIALLIVVSLLTVIGIMGVAFAFSMYLETQATRQFVSTTQARYLAEAGVSVARALLDEDRLGSRVDELTEAWASGPVGSDVDVDGDKAPDAKWQDVTGAEGRPLGRYAVAITDESGKANLNVALAEPSPLTLGAIDLTTLLAQAGIGAAAAEAIEQYRYGDDARPGLGGIDDDADGAIDEVDEYQPAALRGDDRRLESLEDLALIAGLDAEAIRRLARVATVYSWDLNASVTGAARVNVNTATAEELLSVLLDAGVDDPWQAAVNMADYVDDDVELSYVTKSSQVLVISNQGSLGSWEWTDEPEGHYASEGPSGSSLSWVLPVPVGTFRVRALGIAGVKVGDVTVAGQSKPSVDPGEALGTFELNGTLTVAVANREAAGTACAFRGVELVSDSSSGGGGVVVQGIEPIRVNELMVEPTTTFDVGAAVFDPQGSGWNCSSGGACTNSGVGQARWVWTNALLPPGRYHVRVFGTAAGQTVGEVRIEGNSQLLVHEERHPSAALVGTDGKFTLTIGKTAAEGTYYLTSVSLSLQPDGEYVELINLSDEDVDASGWTLEGELTGGRKGELPSGSVIPAHGLLLAAVDLDDAQLGLGGNGIGARSAWDIAGEASCVQLEFPDGAPSPDDDWLKATVPSGPSRLILRSGGVSVDEVEYPIPLPTTADFQSLEKGDPSVRVDQDADGVDDGWYPSLQLYTPGVANDNNGVRELVGLEVIVHDPAKEITVLNRPLGGVGELAGLPSGMAWEPFASADLAKLVDRLTVEGMRLEAEGHLEAGGEAWLEKAEGSYEHSSTDEPAVPGAWRWTDVPDGEYRLSLYAWSGEQLSVRWAQPDGTFSEWSPALSANARGRIVVGQVTVAAPGSGEGANALTLEIRCASPSGVCHLDYIRLDPQLMRIGPVNVNTAPLEVLRALPGMTDAAASRLIAGRPYGDQDEKGRGIGDLLLGDVFGTDEEEKLAVFRRVAHLLTTRSEVFQIQSIGQPMDDDRPGALQRILAVVQR